MPFSISSLPQISLASGDFVMATVRSHDQFNTTIYGMNDRYKGVYKETRVIFMNKEDIAEDGFKAGDKVDLYNYKEGVE
jgi:anaerobic selenocysteine-containing dehydrogenase